MSTLRKWPEWLVVFLVIVLVNLALNFLLHPILVQAQGDNSVAVAASGGYAVIATPYKYVIVRMDSSGWVGPVLTRNW